jgi:hypothetical protein
MRDNFQKRIDKFNSIKDAELKGIVADSLAVRKAMLEKVHAGQITLEEAQRQLKKIKSTAKSNGLITRDEAYKRG